MKLSTEEIEALEYLEESLWKTATRFDMEYMENILTPDFFEFGRSGKIYMRKDTLHGIHPQEIIATIKNFEVHPVTEDVMQTTYISEVTYSDEIEVSNRSSIWVKTSSGWKLRFHQGTPTQN